LSGCPRHRHVIGPDHRLVLHLGAKPLAPTILETCRSRAPLGSGFFAARSVHRSPVLPNVRRATHRGKRVVHGPRPRPMTSSAPDASARMP
jgi:hypothetical protein